jgi:hypothetical protein
MRDRRAALRGAGVAAAALVLFAPPLAAVVPASDYVIHVAEAEYFVAHGSTRLPVLPLFFLLVALGHAALPGVDPLAVGLGVALAAHALLAVVLAAWLRRALAPLGEGTPVALASACGALSLMTVMPVNLLGLGERNLYFGYVSPTAYHNPSVALLKPFVPLLFGAALASLRPRGGPAAAGRVAGAAVLSLLGALAKPSYAIVLLPALALATLAQQLRGRAVDWRLQILGLALPAGAVVAALYAWAFSAAQIVSPGGGTASVAFAPLLVMRTLSPGGLAWKLLLSIAFPACVYAAWFGRARRSLLLNFAWLGFALGAAEGYLLAETGPRLRDGNFLWAGQVALFALFAASAAFALRRVAEASRAGGPRLSARAGLCAAVYALHAASGAVFYAVHVWPLVDPGAPLLKDWF